MLPARAKAGWNMDCLLFVTLPSKLRDDMKELVVVERGGGQQVVDTSLCLDASERDCEACSFATLSKGPLAAVRMLGA